MTTRVLDDQTSDVDKLFDQLYEGEVLLVGFRYGSKEDAGLYLYQRTQSELESRMNCAEGPVTFYAVPEEEI